MREDTKSVAHVDFLLIVSEYVEYGMVGRGLRRLVCPIVPVPIRCLFHLYVCDLHSSSHSFAKVLFLLISNAFV